MSVTATELAAKKCQACEGGIPAMTADQITAHLPAVPGWAVTDDGKMIRRKWKFKDFVSALAFLNKVGEVAEQEQHHPELHLHGYRFATVEITTHAANGLTENDFVLAAKIDQLS
jgi:4a-hydroxytetrahydrobiopterin dehydratase